MQHTPKKGKGRSVDIELLNRPIEPVENPGLETTDPRLGSIVTHVQNGDYHQAAVEAQSTFEEGIYDIRLVGFFLYGIFLDQGLHALDGVFQAITRLFQENWEAVGPAKKRERHAQVGLNWMIKQLAKILEYEENRQGDAWNQWMREITSEDVEQIIKTLDDVQTALSLKLEDAARPLQEGLLRIKKWLTNFQQLVYQEPETVESPEIEIEAVDSPLPENDMVTSDTPPPVANMSDIESGGSYHLNMLLKKLKAFDKLIHQKNYAMAAMVADDIDNIISDFDPKIYFPELFASYSFLRARNISEISSFNEQRQTLEWQALLDLYKIDLDRFLLFDKEHIDTDFFKTRHVANGNKNGYEPSTEDYSQEPDDGSEAVDDDWE